MKPTSKKARQFSGVVFETLLPLNVRLGGRPNLPSKCKRNMTRTGGWLQVPPGGAMTSVPKAQNHGVGKSGKKLSMTLSGMKKN